jgi:hypothetical protein
VRIVSAIADDRRAFLAFIPYVYDADAHTDHGRRHSMSPQFFDALKNLEDHTKHLVARFV